MNCLARHSSSWWNHEQSLTALRLNELTTNYFSSFWPWTHWHMRLEWHFTQEIFKVTLVIDNWDISHEIAVRWMQLNLTDEKSTLVQVMATGHYLNQHWRRPMSPYGVTRPQSVYSLRIGKGGICASENWVIVGLGNGLSSVCCTSTKALTEAMLNCCQLDF